MTSGRVPLVTIGKLCDFTNGHGFTPDDWKTSGLPIIRIQNLNGSKEFNYYQGVPKEEWIVNPGDLLFAWAGVKGVSFGPTIWNGPVGVLNQHIYRIQPKDGINKQWLYYVLKLVTFEIEKKAHGFKTSLVHVHKSDITRAAVANLSSKDQSNLADLLSSWDAAIEKTERLITAKENKYISEYVSLLFGKHQITSEKRSTKWFSIPRHWRLATISEIAKEISLTNTTGESLPVLSCTKYDGLVDSLTYFDKQIFSQDTTKYKVVKKGQFAYATNHIEEGSIGYQNLYPKGLVSPMYTVFETNGEVLDGYLYKILKTETYRHIFETHTSASVDRRGSLRWSQFSSLPIPIPPLKEQEEIKNILDLALEEISILKQILESYKKQKRGLIQKLLTGQWRVKTDPDRPGDLAAG